MSTNKTTNYQLHLWEPGDNFLREEFNENNVKVDGELARVEGMASTAPVLLASAQLESEAHTLTMDVSHIDLSQYGELRLVVSCNSAGTAGTQPLCMQVNGVSDNSPYFYQSGTLSSSQGNYMIVGYSDTTGNYDTLFDITLYHTSRLILFSRGLRASSSAVSASQYCGSAPFCSIDTLDSLTLLCGINGANFAVGSKMFLLGHKY